MSVYAAGVLILRYKVAQTGQEAGEDVGCITQIPPISCPGILTRLTGRPIHFCEDRDMHTAIKHLEMGRVCYEGRRRIIDGSFLLEQEECVPLGCNKEQDIPIPIVLK